MTKRLILIRHAKSSWDDPFSDDHARVLNPRGQASAKAVGMWLNDEGYVPDLVLCSDAARTVETSERILTQLQTAPEVQTSGRIYHAAPDTILDLIHGQSVPTLAVIGHNPGIGMLANALVKQAPQHHRFSDYPTCGTTVIDFDTDNWKAIQPRNGSCTAFIVPRDLIGTSSHDID